MAKLSLLQSNLNAGELSPLLRGRQNVARYRDGLELCRNAIPLVTGGATRRPGRRHVAKTFFPDARLIPFVLEVDGVLTGYQIEVASLVLTFYKNGTQILDGGGNPVRIWNGFVTAEIRDLRYAQEEDSLYLVHPSRGIWKVTRTSDTAWSFTQHTPKKWPYFRPKGTEEITLTPSETSGNITLTASAPLFSDGHVGSRFQVNGGLVEVISYTDSTHVQATVREQIPSGGLKRYKDTTTITFSPYLEGSALSYPHQVTIETTADYAADTLTTTSTGSVPGEVVISTVRTEATLTGTDPDKNWKEQAWSAVRGWPGAICFSGQRMVLGYTKSQPTTVWGSRIGELTDFTAGTEDDAPYAFTLAQASTRLLHLAAADEILAFTYDRELSLGGGNNASITPTNVQVDDPTAHGCSLRVRPIKAPRGYLFASPDGREIRSIQYALELDGYSAPDIAVAASHLLDDGEGIVEAAYARRPVPCIWAVTTSGRLLSCTYDPDQEVIAWAWHESPATYKSVCVTPGAGGADQVCVVLYRAGYGWVECLDPLFNTDSAVTGTGQVIGGLSHLEGEEVAIVADGFVLPRQSVAGGQVDLGAAYTAVEVGLPYTTTIKDLPPAIEGGAGAATSVNRIMVLLHKSQGCTLNGEQIPFNQLDGTAPGELILDTPVQPFTGWKRLNAMTGWSDEGTTAQVEIVQDLPLPLTVLAIVKEVSANAG